MKIRTIELTYIHISRIFDLENIHIDNSVCTCVMKDTYFPCAIVDDDCSWISRISEKLISQANEVTNWNMLLCERLSAEGK